MNKKVHTLSDIKLSKGNNSKKGNNNAGHTTITILKSRISEEIRNMVVDTITYLDNDPKIIELITKSIDKHGNSIAHKKAKVIRTVMDSLINNISSSSMVSDDILLESFKILADKLESLAIYGIGCEDAINKIIEGYKESQAKIIELEAKLLSCEKEIESLKNIIENSVEIDQDKYKAEINNLAIQRKEMKLNAIKKVGEYMGQNNLTVLEKFLN